MCGLIGGFILYACGFWIIYTFCSWLAKVTGNDMWIVAGVIGGFCSPPILALLYYIIIRPTLSVAKKIPWYFLLALAVFGVIMVVLAVNNNNVYQTNQNDLVSGNVTISSEQNSPSTSNYVYATAKVRNDSDIEKRFNFKVTLRFEDGTSCDAITNESFPYPGINVAAHSSFGWNDQLLCLWPSNSPDPAKITITSCTMQVYDAENWSNLLVEKQCSP